MPAPNEKVTEAEFVRLFQTLGSPKKVAEAIGVDIRKVYERRTKLEKRGYTLPSFAAQQKSFNGTYIPEGRRIITHGVDNGMVVVASDCHYWPGESTPAHKAFVEIIKQYKPKTVVLNGDVFDGARTSRHDALFGAVTPTAKQELEACQERLDEIEKAYKSATRFWLYGNHDIRLWKYIYSNAPEILGLNGTDLWGDYFAGWHHGWRLDINDAVVIKHRLFNGVHASYNNVLKSGKSMVTGHLHRLCITPWGDYNGRRWGVDTGTLADPSGEQFRYMEEAPTPGCSGFAVLTFKNGMLLPPELCEVVNGHAYFRGQEVV